MADYDAWSRAVAAYFMAGAAKGTPIFLSVEAEAIEDVAERFLDEVVSDNPVEDFKAAVRDRCVLPWGTVSLSSTMGRIGDVPAGVGFLALMVYAANQMRDDGEINDLNYFLRLREALGLQPVQSRPDGMPAGSEEPLWLAWNQYVIGAGFQATAERGSGPQTFLRYVISQAILRECDKDYLCDLFKVRSVPLCLDCDQIGFWLSRQQINRKHLREGLHHPDPSRMWEFYRASHRTYESIDWTDPSGSSRHIKHTRSRNVECGLYRVDNLLGDVEYHLFPKQPARNRSTVLSVSSPTGETTRELRPLRAGFFAPLWPQVPFVDAPLECSIAGDKHLRSMLFPRRDFWVLVVDPENPYGAWASWRPYLELGERVLVLCRAGAFDHEMARFHDAKLIEWERRVECSSWVEFQGCMVLSYDWSGFIGTPECRSLAEALAPRAMAGVSLVGGLRDPNQNAWLEGCGPQVKVYGFEREFEVIVTSAHGEECFCDEVARQAVISLPPLAPDTYQVEARWSGTRSTSRMFRVISWDNIREHPDPHIIRNSSPAATGGLTLSGAWIIEDSDSGEVPHA